MSSPIPVRVRRFAGLLTAALCVSALAASPALASPAKVGPPTSIDALGDSITRGYNSQGVGCGTLADCPANSWATGSNAAVNSYFTRVKALNPSVVLARPQTSSTAGGNDAITGAKMANLPAEATNAVNAPNKPDQVMILLGANDVCTSSEATMTSLASFEANLRAGLNILSSGVPDARIDISSIPNIFNLWNVLHNNLSAQLVWGLAGVCQSMLASPTSLSQANVDRRARVQQRNIDLNSKLRDVCAQYIHCHYDGGAAYALNFVASDVGTIDYFHPNTNGQAKAAAAAFANGPNFADLTAPTTTITRDHPAAGVDDWYRENVTVSLSATDPNSPVAGTEYFYKLDGAADAPWTKYTAPITVSAEGQTTITARSVDANGNVEASRSDVIKIDKTAPTFTLGCPSGAVLLNSDAHHTISAAADDRSGFASDPSGDFPISTATAGAQPDVVQIADKAGNTTSHSCTVNVIYPDPGTPALDSGASPNATGVFGLAWTPSADPAGYPSLRYTLQQRDADDADWSNVDDALATAGYLFPAFAPTAEGTWRYRVQAHDGALETGFSAASDTVKVDKSAPAAPTLTADRAPDYAGGSGWYRDAVTVSSADNGDPALQDGSAGTGVDAATVAAPRTVTAGGSTTLTDVVSDAVGNASAAGSLGVLVDPDAPLLSIGCPAAVLLHAPGIAATVAASDPLSGLASDPSGTVPISTATVGDKTVARTATDNVGHSTSASCTTGVRYMSSGVQQPVNPDGSSIFKLNSAVPLKFRLTDFGILPISGAVAKLTVAKLTGQVEGTYLEAEAKGSSSTDNVFSQDGDGQYHYNLDTKTMSTGTWSAKITLDDGTSASTRFSLR
jgi:lysophospholipase L1-like esterase